MNATAVRHLIMQSPIRLSTRSGLRCVPKPLGRLRSPNAEGAGIALLAFKGANDRRRPEHHT